VSTVSNEMIINSNYATFAVHKVVNDVLITFSPKRLCIIYFTTVLASVNNFFADSGQFCKFLSYVATTIYTENVQFFSHLHLKSSKSANMTQKIFFLKNITMGNQKRRILC
jgi:hypothetical protein